VLIIGCQNDTLTEISSFAVGTVLEQVSKYSNSNRTVPEHFRDRFVSFDV